MSHVTLSLPTLVEFVMSSLENVKKIPHALADRLSI